MFTKKIETLKNEKRGSLRYNTLKINRLKNKIEEYLKERNYFYDPKFALDTLFPQELSFNNKLEGYHDDLELIINKIKNRNLSREEQNRIINLYYGYSYILNKKEITEENIIELYDILSEGLLDDYSKENMGKFYRNQEVYILSHGLDFDKGIPADKLEEYMTYYLDYIKEPEETKIDEFIKSQIMHYYLVYIHPYFDVNGRTSRTIALWYLLNKEAYPYLLFNRAIYFNRKIYKKTIRVTNQTGDLTSFLEFVLKSVLKELENSEKIISIKENIFLTEEEQEILEYFLHLENPTIKTLALTCNGYDPHKDSSGVIEKIYSLVEKGVLKLSETSKKTYLSLNNLYKEPNKTKLKNKF